MFKFRSGTHGLNEELGRHSDRDGRVECTLCGAECESVVHVFLVIVLVGIIFRKRSSNCYVLDMRNWKHLVL